MGAFDDLVPKKAGSASAGSFADLVPQAPVRDAAHQQARDYLDAHPEYKNKGGFDYAQKAAQGATMGFADEAVAAAAAARDWLKHPFQHSATHYYDLEKAMQDEQLKDATNNTGVLGTVAEVAGGLGTGLGAAKAGLTLMRPGQGLVKTIAAAAGEGAGYGALSGAGGADGNRINGAANGAALGAALGGAIPAVGALAKPFVSPVVSNIHARINPEGYAQNQLAKTLERSGRTAAEIDAELAAANAAGQGNYTLADALGESGQKQLAGLMKSPGQEKQAAAEWLDARNRGMGRNVQGHVDEAFNTHGNTAKEFTGLMEAARAKAGDIRYGAARQGAGPVDLGNTVSVAEDIRDPSGVFSGDVSAAESMASGPVERAIRLATRPGHGNTSSANFSTVLDAKGQIGDIATEAGRAGRGYEAGQVNRIKQALDAALQDASPGYRRANDTFSRMSRPIDAVPVGQKAATSGRSADNINAFNDMGRPGQQGFRVGYADKLNESLGGPTVGRRINEMLHGDVADEIGAFATPGRADLLNERLRRSANMIRTGNAANGGSQTVELAGQQSDIGIDPVAAASNLMGGNIGGFLKHLAGGVANGMNGNTEAVRNNLIPLLLSRANGGGRSVNLGNLLQSLEAQSLGRQNTANGLKRGVLSGLMPASMLASYANQQPATVNVTQENIDAFNARNPSRLVQR